MTAKTLIALLTGLVVGAGIGVITSKKYFENKYEKALEKKKKELENYYGYVDEYTKENITEVGKETNNKEESGILPTEERNRIKQEMKKKRQHVDYHSMYQNNSSDDNENDMEEVEKSEEEEWMEEHLRERNLPPKIISEKALGDIPEYYQSETLYLYTYNDVITDDEGNVIDEPHHLLGDCLDRFDFYDSNEKVIYIQNYEHITIYEVQKIVAAFEE